MICSGADSVAVDAAEAFFALDDFLRAVESALGEQRGQHAVGGGLAGVKRLAHGAAVLLHAGGLGGGDAQRISQALLVELEQLAGGRACRDAAERAGQVPAAVVVARRRAAAAHARLETDGVGKHEVAPAHRRALGQREQRRQHRRTRVQHDAAHVGVVVIEQVPHLAVGQRRFQQTELEPAPDDRRLRFAADLLQDAEQRVDGAVPAPRQRAARPVEEAAARFAHCRRREVFITRSGKMAAQRFGQRDGIGIERLVHVVSVLFLFAPDAGFADDFRPARNVDLD